jgi:hypothetical protein
MGAPHHTAEDHHQNGGLSDGCADLEAVQIPGQRHGRDAVGHHLLPGVILAPDFITVSTNTVVALVGLASAAGGLKFILPDAPPPPVPPAPPDGLGGRGA